jgi:hypothetical protein
MGCLFKHLYVEARASKGERCGEAADSRSDYDCAHGVDVSKQAGVFNCRASIDDYCHAGLLGAAGRFEVNYAELAPQYARAFGDCFFHYLRDELGAAEDVYYFYWLGDRCEIRVTLLAQRGAQSVAVQLRIYRNHLEAAALEEFGNFE